MFNEDNLKKAQKSFPACSKQLDIVFMQRNRLSASSYMIFWDYLLLSRKTDNTGRFFKQLKTIFILGAEAVKSKFSFCQEWSDSLSSHLIGFDQVHVQQLLYEYSLSVLQSGAIKPQLKKRVQQHDMIKRAHVKTQRAENNVKNMRELWHHYCLMY